MIVFKSFLFGLLKFLFVFLFYISKYRLFKKMGSKGWVALIPIYSEIVLYKKLKLHYGFIVFYMVLKLIEFLITITWLFISIIGIICIITIVLYFVHDDIFDIANNILNVTVYIDFLVYLLEIYVVYNLARRFGKSNNESIVWGIINPIAIIYFGLNNDKFREVNGGKKY